jgi:hypothetical protein
MSFSTGISIPELCNAMEKAAERYAALLVQVKDPTLPAIGTWNIEETALHTSTSGSYFLSLARGETEPLSLDSDHSVFIETDLDRDMQVLVERFMAGERALIEYARGLENDPEVELFRDLKAPTSTLLAVELSEILVHGYDIARASGLAWQIPKDEAAVAVGGVIPLWPFFVDQQSAAGFKGRFELRIRDGARTVLEFDDAKLKIEEPSEDPVDCYLSFDPAVFLLLSFNRIQPWGPLLQGKMSAWGRRFWLMGKYASLFQTP